MIAPVKPPFAYYGGKARIAPWLVSLMPAHDTYVEPCVGGGAVFFAKGPVEHEVVNDLDAALVTFFRCLRDQPDELIRLCEATPYARAERAAVDLEAADGLELARQWWVHINTAFSGMPRVTAGFSASNRRGASGPKTVKRRVEVLHLAAERLRGAIIECLPAAELVAHYDSPSTLFYVDPPYVADTRESRSRSAYRHEMTDADHRELAAELGRANGTVMVSGYDSDLYAELYHGWHRTTRTVRNMSSTTVRGESGDDATEVVWSNRPIGDQLALDLGGVA